MPELRKDYILNRYVIIATERSKRPHEFKIPEQFEEPKQCYFCPGNESTTPPEIGRIPKDSKDWQMRYFPNKYAAVAMSGNADIRTDNTFYSFASGFGMHEILVETRIHSEQLWDLPISDFITLLRLFSERIDALQRLPGIKYVSVFKNHGRAAGTSIVHSHSQIIAYNMIPVDIAEKEDAIKGYNYCPYCRILETERGSYRRIDESNTAVCFTPYASMFPLEAWILPKRHVVKMGDLSITELGNMAEHLKKVLSKLKELCAPYNFYIHYGVCNLHLQIILTPRLATWAGFEHATGTIINSMSPEEAAVFYRG